MQIEKAENADKVEKVLGAARPVFLRYGYKRTTMNDIAEAAKMSRPAVYLVFPSKEEIFAAVLQQALQEMLDVVRFGLVRYDSVPEKMAFAFETWCVQPYEMTLASPDAKDLLESGYEYANDVVSAAFAEFEAMVAEVLEPVVRAQTAMPLSAEQVTRILVSAVSGFKQSARDAPELRQQLSRLFVIIYASLGLKTAAA